ncbi:hypothetical protein IAT40_001761 [Kwoniella sp. CBS 6097]
MSVATQTPPLLPGDRTSDWSKASWASVDSNSLSNNSQATQLAGPLSRGLSAIAKQWSSNRRTGLKGGDISHHLPRPPMHGEDDSGQFTSSENNDSSPTIVRGPQTLCGGLGDSALASRSPPSYARSTDMHKQSSGVTSPGMPGFGHSSIPSGARDLSWERQRASELTAEFKSSVAAMTEAKRRSGATSLKDRIVGSTAGGALSQYRSDVWKKASDWAKNIKATQGGFTINHGGRIDVSDMDEDVMTAAATDILLKHDARAQLPTHTVRTIEFTNQDTGRKTVTHRGDTWALGY